MGLFGGSSSRSSTAVTEYNFANYNTGASAAGGAPNFNLAGITNSGRDGTLNLDIQTSDFGAIAAGRDIAQSALDKGFQSFRASLDTMAAQSREIVGKSLGIAAAKENPEGSQLLDAVKQIGIGIAVVIIVGVIAKGKGS